MKGKFKYLLLASLFSLASLTGCGNSGDSGKEGEDGGDNDPKPMDTISGLDLKIDEAKNKLKQLGATSGFEITVDAIASSDEDDSLAVETYTLGFKVDTAWMADEGAYKMTGKGTEMFEPTDVPGEYLYVATTEGSLFDQFIDTITALFYVPYQFDSYLNKVGPTTFINRPATKYEFAGAYATAFANIEVIIDDATGIALKFAGSATDLDGNSAEGSLIVKSFKTDIEKPVLKYSSDPQGDDTVEVTSVSVSPATLKLKAGETSTLTATVLPADATNKTVTWKSDNETVATVNNGVVTAVAEGKTKIIASAGDKFGFCELEVTKKEQGGEGEDPQVQYPTAGKYSYNANLTTEPGIYADGYLQINEDGNGVYCIVGNYLGERVWYTASFELSGLNIIAKTVFKYTETIETGRSKETVEQVTYTFTFEGDANWSIELNGSKIYYQYDQGQGGDTPIENLDDALVTAQQFASLVNGMAYIGAEGNAKFNKQIKSNNLVYSNETLENDNGNYQDGVAYADESAVSVRVYGQSTEHQGYYDVYERNSDFTWSKYGPFNYGDEIFGEMAGLYLLSQVPFEKYSAPISESAPYYACSLYEDEDHGVALSNIKVYFDKGQLVHFSYKSGGYTEVDVEVTDIGKVKVEVPEVKPEEKEEQHNELIYGTDGAKFVFSSVDKDGYTGTDLDAVIVAMPKVSFNFFKDGKGELINTNNDINNVFLGSYTLMIKSGSDTGTVALSLSEQYVDGLKHESYTPETQTFTYKAQEDELHLIMTKDGHNVDFKFIRSSDVPTPFTPEGGGDQPTDSNWPVDAINTGLQSLGLKAVIPEISGAENLAETATVTVKDKTLTISCTFDTDQNAQVSFYTYLSTLTDAKNGYTMDYNSSNPDNNLYAFLSKDNSVLVEVMYDGTKGITIEVEEAPVSPYPTDAISAWLTNHNVTDEIIEFKYDKAQYMFDSENGFLMITMPADADLESVASGFKASLLKKEYSSTTLGESDVLVAPNRTIGFQIVASTSNYIAVVFLDSGFLPQEESSTFPSEELGEFLEQYEITDAVPALVYEGATYTLYCKKDEEGFWPEEFLVAIALPEGTTSESAIGELEDLLVDFTWDDDKEMFISENKQVGIDLFADNSYIGVTISALAPEVDKTIYPSDFINSYLKDNGVSDLLPELAVEGATYETYGEKGEDELWSESIGVTIQLPEGADSEAIEAKLISSLQGFKLDESEQFYISENNQIAVHFYAGDDYIEIEISAIKEPQFVELAITALRTGTVEGQRVYLVGDFCNWDPTNENAIVFDWDNEKQAWVSEATFEVGLEIHCKLIITSWDNPGEYINWEKEGTDNERVIVISDTEPTLNLIWGNY